ncbi:acetoacetate--CoA ligase [Amycolatopsis pithecellobii]|uniref:Acetoacetate--CoA ligase n=1 Tax=Amycolatopsis pithecellobii TaxID=664692 RepID=A0A6N7Z6E9_9PSEU|nr:acetoacetate--CoA ligase [Amycolatopsis pithecellobii]MTD56454.1 acetoacetate--CoA ligase [Amycolatopsis pithecellobii]
MPADTAHGNPPIWLPDDAEARSSQLGKFCEFIAKKHRAPISSYAELQQWSVDSRDEFWQSIWDFFDIAADGERQPVLSGSTMPGIHWFPNAYLNYAEHALRHGADDAVAMIGVVEPGTSVTYTWGQLRAQVASLASWLRRRGVINGDRVVGYLPNGPHAVIGLLAAASIGAVWSVCGQDYSPAAAAARLGQLEPTVLIAADGYHWNGTTRDRRDAAEELRRSLPTLRECVHVPHLGLAIRDDELWTPWQDTIADPAPLQFDRVAFDTPLWVLFSSGTTGQPKGIVHGHGGVVLEHCKLLGLHFGLSGGDRFTWYTTTNWMMWNLVVSGLLTGATIVVYDGSPVHPTPRRMFELAAETRARMLGVSPGYLLAAEKAGVEVGDLDLGALTTLGSTGSPLPPQSYFWVRDHLGPRVQLASGTGGTDVVSGFAGSTPNTPVWPGEISAVNLGVALESWDDDGHPQVGEVGELVVTRPMPSMPVAFWNDPDGRKYREAYFSRYPGVWRHGDWVTVTPRGSVIVTGRSDSTLNRHGVRLGSAEIYQVVEAFPEIAEALVIGAELDGGRYWLALFVVLAPGVVLDTELDARLRSAIASQASPRHVPDDIIALTSLPHTRTGKKLEIPVKRIIQGVPPAVAASRDAVDDPAALTQFERYAGGVRQGPSDRDLRRDQP